MLDHTALLNERIANWTVGGYGVDTEAQNRFELHGRTATLAGRPDIIAHRPGKAVIVDAKTGHDSPSHAVQVMIYLYAIPRALQGYRGAKLRGQVTYRDHTIRISADAVDDQFIQNLGALIRRISGEEPARRVPSRQECRFCDISAADCPERVDVDLRPEEGTTEDFCPIRKVRRPIRRPHGEDALLHCTGAGQTTAPKCHGSAEHPQKSPSRRLHKIRTDTNYRPLVQHQNGPAIQCATRKTLPSPMTPDG